MKKMTLRAGMFMFLSLGWLFTSCNSGVKQEREELAEAQEEALESTDEAYDELRNADDREDLAEVRDELKEAKAELTEKQRSYIEKMRERQEKIQKRLSVMDSKIASSSGDTKARWVERRTKLMRERDLLQANLLEMQEPMTSEQLVSVEKQIDELLKAIDTELATTTK